MGDDGRGLTDEMVGYLYDTAMMMVSGKGLSDWDSEEIVQDAVCHVARYWRYDPARGCSWRTYGSRALRNRVCTMLAEMRRHLHEELPDRIPDDRPPGEDAVDDCIEEMAQDEEIREIVRMLYDGIGTRKMAERLKVERKSLDRTIAALLPELRKAIRTGLPIDCGSIPRPRPSRPAGRPGRWTVELLDKDGRAIATYASVAAASRELGIHHNVIIKAKDGHAHTWKRTTWRLRDSAP